MQANRKQSMANQIDSDDEYHTSIEDDEPKFIINTKSTKFRKYKQSILGSLESPFDGFCESFKLEDLGEIKRFVSHIKEYILNDNLNEEHINYFIDTIIKEKGIYFLDRVSLVQYDNHLSQDSESLLEIINGHHRIEALKRFYTTTPPADLVHYKITLRLDIYHLDNPNSDDTSKLFKAFNLVRPQKTLWPAKDLARRIIIALGNSFDSKSRHFVFIKNNEAWTKKPSIHGKYFATKLEDRIKEQFKTVKYITEANSSDLDITPIINKFKTYNDELKTNPLEWFNDIRQRGKIDNDNGINHKIFERAKKVNCYLGFVRLDYLLNQCVSL